MHVHLWVCDQCDQQQYSDEDAELPEGWVQTGRGDFCGQMCAVEAGRVAAERTVAQGLQR